MHLVEYIMSDDNGTPTRFKFHYDTDYELEALIKPELHRLLNIREMAQCVIDEFDDSEIDDLRNLDQDELLVLHRSIGRDIRNAFGLWLGGNPNVTTHPDATSMTVLKVMWTLVQNTSSGGSQVMTFK